MRAVVITRHGRPEVLQVQERPRPARRARARCGSPCKAAGINFADTMARLGLYPDAPKPPCVVGYEVAGEVESVGEGVEDSQGRRPRDRRDPVRRPGRARHGSRRAGASRCRRSSRFEQGAAFPVNYGTAYAALVIMGGLQAGRAGADPRRGGRGRDLRDPDREGHRAPRSSARRPAPSTTRSASRASTTRSTTATRTSPRRCMRITGGEGVDVIMDALGPTSASARTTACCARAAG